MRFHHLKIISVTTSTKKLSMSACYCCTVVFIDLTDFHPFLICSRTNFLICTTMHRKNATPSASHNPLPYRAQSSARILLVSLVLYFFFLNVVDCMILVVVVNVLRVLQVLVKVIMDSTCGLQFPMCPTL